MAPPKIRHYYGYPEVKLKGKPVPFLKEWEYRPEGDGYWVRTEIYKRVAKQNAIAARDARIARRNAQKARTPFGPGSGREGGGRRTARNRAHRGHPDGSPQSELNVRYGGPFVNSDTKPDDCPVCYGKTLLELWMFSGQYGLYGWENFWDPWPEDEVMRRALKKLKLRARNHIMRTPKEFAAMRQKVVEESTRDIAILRDRQEDADRFFERYLQTHRDPEDCALPPYSYEEEHVPYRRDSLRRKYAMVVYTGGIPTGINTNPEPKPTHEQVIPTETHTNLEALSTQGDPKPPETNSNEGELATHGDPKPTKFHID